jgi:hypothetical protein
MHTLLNSCPLSSAAITMEAYIAPPAQTAHLHSICIDAVATYSFSGSSSGAANCLVGCVLAYALVHSARSLSAVL